MNAAQLNREIRSFALQVKASDNGIVEGYGSVFNVKDNYSDIIAKGAFLDSLASHKANGTMPAMLWQHDASQPIGVWTEMSEDENGLRIKGKLAMETVKGREAHELLKMGALTGLSIGFMTKKWDYDQQSEVRTLTDVDLWEVSLVTFPANEKARVTSVKASDIDAITTIREAETTLRDAGFSSKAAKAFIAEVKKIAFHEREVLEAVAEKQAAEKLLETMTKLKEQIHVGNLENP